MAANEKLKFVWQCENCRAVYTPRPGKLIDPRLIAEGIGAGSFKMRGDDACCDRSVIRAIPKKESP